MQVFRSATRNIYQAVRVYSRLIKEDDIPGYEIFLAMTDLCKSAMFHHNIIGQHAIFLLTGLLRK
jgi:hypothetical protein